MNCAYHSDREVQGICSTCGRPICQDCMVDLSGQVHCKKCIEVRMRKPARDVNGNIRFALSIVPGLGHLYMGLFNRGVQLGAATVLGAALLEMIMVDHLTPFYIFAMIFFSIFDAREAYLRLEQGLEVEDKGFVDLKTWKLEWNSRYVGYGLMGLGALALYNTLMRDFLRLLFGRTQFYYDLVSTLNGVILGAAAVAVGLYLLRRDTGRS